jgi:hypothetical protein
MNKVVPLFLIEILVLSVSWTGLTTYILFSSLILFGLVLVGLYYNGRATCRHSGFKPRTAWPAHLLYRFRRRRRIYLLQTSTFKYRSTDCALLGGSDDLHHSHEVTPLNSASPTPWKPDWEAAKPACKPYRRKKLLTPGLPTLWDSPKKEIDPQVYMGANPWNLTSGRVPQIIKPASRRITPTHTVPDPQSHQLDSWASNVFHRCEEHC